MIIGGNKEKVIENIKEAVKKGEFNSKVEVDDPNLTGKEKSDVTKRYLKKYKSWGYRVCNVGARAIADTVTKAVNRDMPIYGMENIEGIKSGAIVTSNHFNPIDNTAVRMTVNKAGHRRLFIVSQDTNFAMKGFVGFLMNHEDVLPIINSSVYMKEIFPDILKTLIAKKEFILIYPEQEMWFNYRKPRPPKRGAYYYAALNNVPIVSCFVEIRELPEKDNDEFYKTKYIMHVLKTIYPDKELSVRENSKIMMETDYRQKVEAYEKAYGKKLTYDFEDDDIAGLIKE